MNHVLLSTFFLAVGPLFFGLLSRYPQVLALLQAVSTGFLLVLLGWHSIPEVLMHGKMAGLALLLFGLWLPYWLSTGRKGHWLGRITLALGMLFTLLHAGLDGIGLHGDTALIGAIVLHRLLEGVAIWSILLPQLGLLYACLFVMLMGLTSYVAYALALPFDMSVESTWGALLQALVIGSMLHVLGHCQAQKGWSYRLQQGLGGILALGLLLGWPLGHHHDAVALAPHSGVAMGMQLLGFVVVMVAGWGDWRGCVWPKCCESKHPR